MIQKPKILMKDAFFYGGFFYGIPINYPKEHMGEPDCVSGKKHVQTSPVIKIDGNTVETMRSIYEVENWLTPEQMYGLIHS